MSGLHVKLARASLGLTQRQLAAIASVQPSKLASLEKAGRLAESEALQRVEDAHWARGVCWVSVGAMARVF